MTREETRARLIAMITESLEHASEEHRQNLLEGDTIEEYADTVMAIEEAEGETRH